MLSGSSQSRPEQLIFGRQNYNQVSASSYSGVSKIEQHIFVSFDADPPAIF